METTKEFVNDYFNLTESCYTQIEKYPSLSGFKKPSYINLSTMTMVCDLSIKAQTFFYFVYKKTLNL